MSPENPIGLFDSGVGGLTVLRKVAEKLPYENLIYLGDTARLPYGDKSPEAVLRYTLEGVSFLMQQKIKCLVIACFTASSHALRVLEQTLSIPVFGMIQSGFRELIRATQSRRVAILGTASTIKSGILQSLIQEQEESAVVFSIACPLLVPCIEEGLASHPATRIIVNHYLDCLKEKNIDAALLACTHYPLIRHVIQDVLGPNVRLIEAANDCALQIKQYLKSNALLNPKKTKPSYAFYASDDLEKFRYLTHLFFGSEIRDIQGGNCKTRFASKI